MRLVLPMTLPSAANLHEHWRHRHNRIKQQRNAVRMAWPRQVVVVLPAVVTLTRRAPRMLDDDNLAMSFKGIRDQVAFQLGIDDRDKRIAWVYRQEQGEAVVVIEVEGAGEVGR